MSNASLLARPVKKAEFCLPRQFTTVQELKEAISSLPLLRFPREGCNPRQTAIACHVSDLDEAIAYYRSCGDILPEFYVLGSEVQKAQAKHAAQKLHAFEELQPDMDVQLYFRQGNAPRLTAYPTLVAALQQRGIISYFLERYGTEKFYVRNKKVTYSDADCDVILQFSNKMHDDSRHSSRATCLARHEAEPGYIPVADYKQYFHSHVPIDPGDAICEGGCYAGTRDGRLVNSSTLDFWKALKGQGSIIGFEPVEATVWDLRKALAPYDGIKLDHKALWSYTGSLQLLGNGARACTEAVASGDGNCPCVSIDDYFSASPADGDQLGRGRSGAGCLGWRIPHADRGQAQNSVFHLSALARNGLDYPPPHAA